MEMDNISTKVLKYEHFLNETLGTDLRKLTTLRDNCYEELSQHIQLKTLIEKQFISSSNEPLKTQIDLGCHFYTQAIVPSTKMITVSIGHGIFLELTLKEAKEFITKKIKHLNTKAETISKDIVYVRAQMRMVIEGLKELQNLT